MSREEILNNDVLFKRISGEVDNLFLYLGMSKKEAADKLSRMSSGEVLDMYLAGEYFLTPLYELSLED